MAGSGAGIRTVFGRLIDYARNPLSEAIALLLCHFRLFPHGDHGAILLDGGPSHPLHHLHLPWVFLLYFVCALCSFSYMSPDRLGEMVGLGFDKGKTNKYCINKGKKKKNSIGTQGKGLYI
ncbi:unnamed protein product [Gulo gulo]|uniref:Uncharacterized protein n=1 Tax=Gulo gulo TaxID=48420 RepID=A0A9X9LMH3_GULGU|nr:unnamed protein product [Gulo gulo]